MTETHRANVVSLATAVPRHRLLQTDAAAAAREAFAHRFPDFGGIARVFKSTGIEARHVVKPIDWYLNRWAGPSARRPISKAPRICSSPPPRRRSPRRAAGPRDIDTIVTVSSTGIATPSLEARVAGRLGFRADVERVPVFGLGCAGGVTGLGDRQPPGAGAARLDGADGRVELCTLAFRLDQLTKANMVATALFGDGAAACVLRAGESAASPQIEGAGEHMWPDTLDIMGWNVDPRGSASSSTAPSRPSPRRRSAPAVDGILAAPGHARATRSIASSAIPAAPR